MIYGALACLFIGAVFGALWLTSHIGSGWPPSQYDPKSGERRVVLGISLLMLIAAAGFLIAHLAGD
jgi:hypothetical protein